MQNLQDTISHEIKDTCARTLGVSSFEEVALEKIIKLKIGRGERIAATRIICRYALRHQNSPQVTKLRKLYNL